MIYLFRLGLLLTLCFINSACVTVVDAVSDKPIQPDPNKRSFGAYWDDKQLKTIVAVNLRKADPTFEKLNIRVHSYNSVVLLTGEVPNASLRELAGKTAREVGRVRQVYNELQIGDRRGFVENTQDKWLGSKLKAKLFAYKDIDSSRVALFVENKTVYLMGLLTQAQTQKITNVVRKTKGVNRVVRAIEYID